MAIEPRQRALTEDRLGKDVAKLVNGVVPDTSLPTDLLRTGNVPAPSIPADVLREGDRGTKVAGLDADKRVPKVNLPSDLRYDKADTVVTQAQYDALVTAGTVDATVFYRVIQP